MSRPFHIYRSSAGSGKTFTLAKSYLTLALSRPNAFRNILGVTFTNKATEEMKRRVVDILKAIASGTDHPMARDLCEVLGISSDALTKRAGETLSDILHQYSRFSVVTIDSFFHQVIRSFAREMGLQGTFSIDLDLEKVLQLVIDQMLLEIGEEKQKQLRSWLTEFAENKMEDGQSWDFRRDIASLAKELFKDDFKVFEPEILKLSSQADFFPMLKKELNKVRFSFEKQIGGICAEVDGYLSSKGLSVSDFKSGQNGPCGLFSKVAGKDRRRFEISDPRRAAVSDKSAWLTKANQLNPTLNEALDVFVLKKYTELIQLIDSRLIDYNSVLEVQRYFYTFGILAEVTRYLKKYRDENDVMLIADLPDFLQQIIQDSDTPYIYEKVGSIFGHYLIDEFQDTSTFQWNNFKPLVKNSTDEGKFCMVVGDVKQSIYRFRGGDWALLHDKIQKDIGEYNIEQLNLDTNWRSSRRLVAFNNAFFGSMRQLSSDTFRTSSAEIPDESMRNRVGLQIDRIFATFQDVAQQSPPGSEVDKGSIHVDFISDEDTSDDEKWADEAIARAIHQVEELQRKGYQLRDIAILTRYGREGKRIADAFIAYANSGNQDANLRYEVVSSEALFLTSSHVVRFIVSLIKWLNDEKNQIVFSEWLYEYRHYIRKDPHIGSELFGRLDGWKQMVPPAFVKQRGYLKTLPLYELVENIIRLFELDRVREEFTYLQGFQDAVLDYSKTERGDIPSFLEWWEEVRKERAIQIADENNAIKILTIHKAKGLEFPVVILPFLSWSMDHDPIKDNILWCRGVKKAPFDLLPVVPLRYTSRMTGTYWAEDYYQEKLKAYLDNLNLLYVAFTRPIDRLIVFAPLPRSSGKLNAVNELVYSYASEQSQWNGGTSEFRLGEMERPVAREHATLEYGLSNYQSNPWRGKVSVQLKGSAELNESVLMDAALEGTHVHGLLSRIRYASEINQFVDLPEYSALSKIINHPEITDWFDPRWQVDVEVPILLPDGEFRRIDRLNRTESQTVIIDFKTGTNRSKDHEQVREYTNILQRMGYTGIKGYLIYLKECDVVEVEVE